MEPYCDDGGLALGACLVVYHSFLDQPLRDRAEPYQSAALGPRPSHDAIEHALRRVVHQVEVATLKNPAAQAASDVAANRVIAWFQGPSEAGPRALGQRSILADARIAENWARVNRLKSREWWRPFAPVVLESEAARWFADHPPRSPYMLFNARVTSSSLPAITHRDGTARVQTVDKSHGAYFDVVREFFALTGVPVMINTSFNGPGEPIVESPEDALNFFIKSELDVLYLENRRVVRVGEP